MVVVLLT